MATRAFRQTASELSAIGRRFYARGWALGTSGNFSAVVSRAPLRLAITASAVAKGELGPSDILECDEAGRIIGRRHGKRAAERRPSAARKPSAETLLHIEVARRRHAGAVLHTHSVWSTMLSDVWAPAEPDDQAANVPHHLAIQGYEMLKGLAGVTSHEHRELVPIIDNDQDIPRLAQRVGETLDRLPEIHAFLLRRHGLYTWGDTLVDAARHVEILEFLFETVGRTESRGDGTRPRGGPSWQS